MAVGHCVTETKNSFDGVTHNLKYTEKDYHRARGYVLLPHDLSYSLFYSFFSHLFIIPYSVLLDIHYSVITETV